MVSRWDPDGKLDALAQLEARGVNRRDFMRVVSMAAAAVGLPASLVPKMAEAAVTKRRPSVVWLHFQECTGCTESLLRTSQPGLAEVLLDLISLDYHETLFAAAGHQIEQALETAISENAGEYICIVEGAIPTKDNGVYCKISGHTALEIMEKVGGNAAAVIALGSCASFGGVAAAEPNPTGAKGVPDVFNGKPVVSLPGCPTNPYNLLGVVLQFATFGTLPALDNLGRPLFAFSRTIHEDCQRRPHFDAGRFAEQFGDDGHRQGYCLYKLGCKGPSTHANCSLLDFCDVPGAWPIGIGAPCVGCTEQALAFRMPAFDKVAITRPTPPDTYPPIQPESPDRIDPIATGTAGIIGGLAVGAAAVTAMKLSKQHNEDAAAGKVPEQGKEG